MNNPVSFRRHVKPAIFLLCLIPAAYYAATGITGGLGANPIEALIRGMGDWGLRFLLLTLAVAPAARLPRLGRIMALRRMIGLFAFFYVCLHLGGYVILDQFFDWRAIWADIVKRNYITVGMIVFVMLVPLAVTSTNRMVRRLGGRRWKRLHRLIYPAAMLAVLHFLMMVKADIREPLIYAAILAVLLSFRVWRSQKRPSSRP